MTKKWSGDKTIKFLEEYNDQKGLWMVDSPLYRNRKARKRAYSEIAKAMDISSDEVKAKIRSIRGAYAIEWEKVKRSMQSENVEVYVPRVPWFPVAHQFLEDVIHKKENQDEKAVEHLETLTTEDCSSSDVGSSISHRTPIAQKRFKANNATKTKSAESLKETSPVKTQYFEKEDEFEIYGKNVACQLRRLPEQMYVSSMLYIQQHLTAQRMEASRQKSKTIASSSYIISDDSI